ncbi:MAG: hypothetical protein AAFX44_07575 [Pseudomonadota bacterium]
MAKTRQIPWMNIVAESGAIIASILLAFWIDAWWESRNELDLEREQLLSMREEFTANLEALELLNETINEHSSNIEEFIRILKAAGDEPVVVPDYLLRSAIMWRTSDISTSTLDALMASGSLNVLRNAELRIKLAGLPAVVRDLTEDEELSKNFAESVMAEFVVREGFAEIAYANRMLELKPNFQALGVASEIAVDPSPELIGLLAARRVHFGYAEDGFPKVLSYLSELIIDINKELERQR